jgi:hypothetical protein
VFTAGQIRCIQLVSALVFCAVLICIRMKRHYGFPGLDELVIALLAGAAMPSAVVFALSSFQQTVLSQLPDLHIHLMIAAVAVLYASIKTLVGQTRLIPATDQQMLGPLSIREASYGSDDRKRNVTEILKSMISENRLIAKVTNAALGGDPSPGKRKNLVIRYSIGSREYVRHFPEDDDVDLP